jgi:non-ribosomal peptide synthetase component E (peptide arylation enzyme)
MSAVPDNDRSSATALTPVLARVAAVALAHPSRIAVVSHAGQLSYRELTE